eukprot:154480-Prorocentrum_minimum.AAC.4
MSYTDRAEGVPFSQRAHVDRSHVILQSARVQNIAQSRTGIGVESISPFLAMFVPCVPCNFSREQDRLLNGRVTRIPVPR